MLHCDFEGCLPPVSGIREFGCRQATGTRVQRPDASREGGFSRVWTPASGFCNPAGLAFQAWRKMEDFGRQGG